MVDFAPGMRTIIRDEEWMVKKIETKKFNAHLTFHAGIIATELKKDGAIAVCALTRSQKGAYITSYGRESEFLC